MLKRLFTVLFSFYLVFSVLAAPAALAAEPENEDIGVIVNASPITLTAPVLAEDSLTYVPCWNVIQAFYPTAVSQWQDDQAVISAPGLSLQIKPGRDYVVANGRYLYLPKGVKVAQPGAILLPSRILATILGAGVAWDPVGNDVVFTAGTGPLADAQSVYNENDVYWLSRIINAESGNQPLEGKIAVGNVVLNRVRAPLFPNSIKEVIYQRNQFTPVANGSINLTPNEESVIAAKLCLEGANTVGNALYFINPRYSPNSWAARNRAYVTTIAAHAFYA